MEGFGSHCGYVSSGSVQEVDAARTTPGRKRIPISQEQIEFLLAQDFNIHEIASTLNVSKRTVEYRMNEFDLAVSHKYTILDDEELDEKVFNLTKHFPNSGYKAIQAALKSQGVCVQRGRLRKSVKKVDPTGVERRKAINFHRLFYKLESNGTLDVENEVDIFCLHYCYKDVINEALAKFTSMWNHHPLRTENNRSPKKLYVAGLLQLLKEEDLSNYMTDYQMDDNASAENATINVPRVICPLSEEQLSLLHSATLHIKTKDWYDPAVYLVAKLVCNALLEN
ncbi:unnamed protein product [Clavelina lepadiformis]|uniref:Integrase core domain-containing protein n=1 Tax=Clavelina lepadiformis TaxID=159417 RepID=A0ABP0GH47_CLALP